MTRRLLDDFAMEAMRSQLDAMAFREGREDLESAWKESGVTICEFVAKNSYDYAEAMVKERSFRLAGHKNGDSE